MSARQDMFKKWSSCFCYNKPMEKIKIQNQFFSGGLWIAAWLFTIGYLHLSFWQGVLAIIIWPYYIGSALSILPH
jgi:hypothetical protein